MNSAINKKVRGLKAKQFNKKRYAEKAEMKKKIKQHAERLNKHQTAEAPDDKEAVPAYLLDREGMSHAKVLSNSIKQKRKEKAGKWNVPLPKVRPVGEDEVILSPSHRTQPSTQCLHTKDHVGLAGNSSREQAWW